MFIFFFLERHEFTFHGGTNLLSREARRCLSEKKTKQFFLFYEWHGFTRRHGFAFARGTTMPLGKDKEPFFAGGTNLHFFEAHVCLHEMHSYPSGKEKNFIFLSPRDRFASRVGIYLLPSEAHHEYMADIKGKWKQSAFHITNLK